MATIAQIRAALAKAQAAGNAQDVAALRGALGQSQQAGPSRAQLSQAFYAAQQAGNEADARQIMGYIQRAGMTLAPMDAQQENAAFQKQNAANVAAMPWYDKFDAGMGKAVVDTGRGIEQLVGARSPQQVATDQQADQALTQSGAGMAGDLAGQGLMLAMPGTDAIKGAGFLGKAAPYVNAAVKMGAFAGAQPVTGGESRITNTLEGAGLGVAGEALPAALGAVARKVAPANSVAKQAALATAQRYGIPLHLTQVANGRFTKVLGSAAQYLPFAGSAAADDVQRQAWNRALASTIGQDADELTPQVIANAKAAASADYDRILGANSIEMNGRALDGLSAAQQAAHAELLPEHAQLVDQQIDRVLGNAADNNGVIPGAQYQDLRNTLRRSSAANPALKYHLDAVRHALEDAANEQIPNLGPLNARYNNIKTLEKGLAQVNGANNTVTPANLWRLTQGKYGSTPQMRALAQLGQTVLKDPIHNSGTAQRMLAYRMLDGPAAVGALGAGAFMPHMALPMAALGATGATVGRFMNSPAAARIVPQLGTRVLGGAATLADRVPRLLPLLSTMPPTIPQGVPLVGGPQQ